MMLSSRLALALVSMMVVVAFPQSMVPVTVPVEAPTAVMDPPSLVTALRIQSPLYFCGEEVPLHNPEVRERLERELLLAAGNRAQVILWLKRSARFFPFIEEVLAEHNLPEDLKYVPIVESDLRPHAGSPKGAMGYWQFMTATGQRYGLEINGDIDERRNIFASTVAATQYFKDLKTMFPSWTLCAAAYNMGEAGLKSEILTQELSDYYKLYLPLETQHYIFRILAVKLILSRPSAYGYHLVTSDYYTPLDFERVVFQCAEHVPLQLLAKAAGTDFKVLKDLNPEIRGYYLAPGKRQILIPGGSAAGFASRIETLFAEWKSHPRKIIYVVQPGDSLSGIAERFQVPLPALLIWNRMQARQTIHPGDRLAVYLPFEDFS